MDIRGFFGGNNKPVMAEKTPKSTLASPSTVKTLSSNVKSKSGISLPLKTDSISDSEFLYSDVVKTLSLIEATTKRLEIQDHLVSLFSKVLESHDSDEAKSASLTDVVYLCTNKVAPDFHGVELGVGEGLLTKTIVKATGRTKAAIKEKYDEMGDLGKVVETFKGSQKTLFGHKSKELTVAKVRTELKKIASISGQDAKMQLIDKLIVAATPEESKFLVRGLQGKLRIGLAEQTVLISLAKLFSGKGGNKENEKDAVDTIKQVFCQAPVYEDMINALVTCDGTKTLEKYCHVKAGIPLKPMLAKPTNGISVIFERFEGLDFTCEYKYDGERAQIHLHPERDEIEVYSRNSENHTQKYPDLVPIMSKASQEVKSFILDSEVVAYDDKEGKLLPFQKLTTRKRKAVTQENITVRVIVCAFDLLFLNGESLLSKSLEERRSLMRKHFKEVEHQFVFAKSLDSSLEKHNEDEAELTDFLNQAVTDNCEGLMVKTLKDTYEPSKRSLNWLKLKKDYMNGLSDSLDLVPIGAFYGKGKRTGKFGSFILASYREDEGIFESVTKIGTGFSDEFLEESTKDLGKFVVKEKQSNYACDLMPDVWFSPSQVWEVRAADLSISPVHKSALGLVNASKGIALRFPRFLRIRDDKAVEQATSAEQVADMYRAQNLHTTESDKESVY